MRGFWNFQPAEKRFQYGFSTVSPVENCFSLDSDWFRLVSRSLRQNMFSKPTDFPTRLASCLCSRCLLWVTYRRDDNKKTTRKHVQPGLLVRKRFLLLFSSPQDTSVTKKEMSCHSQPLHINCVCRTNQSVMGKFQNRHPRHPPDTSTPTRTPTRKHKPS